MPRGYARRWVRPDPLFRRSQPCRTQVLARVLRLISMKAEVEPVRQTRMVWLLLAAGAVGGVAGAMTTWLLTAREQPREVAAVPGMRCIEHIDPPSPPQPRIVDNLDSTGLRAHLSQRTRMFDAMSPDSFVPDGNADEIYDLEVEAEQAIRHIYVIQDEAGLQWDTVIGTEQITYKQRFFGHQGGETWHHGAWKNAPDGQIRGLGAGHHMLELVATSPQSYGPRIIAVQFADGTVREIALR